MSFFKSKSKNTAPAVSTPVSGDPAALNVKILGPGCRNCVALMNNAQKAAADLGLSASFEKITDYAVMASYGLMSTPGLVINDQLVVGGRVPSAAEIAEIFQSM
jgi:small redox-active disulfide protein 2